MNTLTTPLAASFSLSVVLHGVVCAALLLSYQQLSSSGRGLEIELVGSVWPAQQPETELSQKNNPADSPVQTRLPPKVEKAVRSEQPQQTIQAAKNSNIAVLKPPVETTGLSGQALEAESQTVEDGDNNALLSRSTSARAQQQSIIELLHQSIGEHKQYPYIARRQRREGTTTIAFVLHADGTIDNARVQTSSQVAVLDRAALSAVTAIAPFTAAPQYIESAEAFEIDVVFNLQ